MFALCSWDPAPTLLGPEFLFGVSFFNHEVVELCIANKFLTDLETFNLCLMRTELIIPTIVRSSIFGASREACVNSADFDIGCGNLDQCVANFLSLNKRLVRLDLSCREETSVKLFLIEHFQGQLSYKARCSLKVDFFMFNTHDDSPERVSIVYLGIVLKR